MNVSRETIYTALLTFLQKAVGFNTVTRVPIPEADIANANFPILEQYASREVAIQQGMNLPPKWNIKQTLMVFASTTDLPNVDTALNKLLDAIEAALAPSPITGYQTLGGVVTSCRFVGTISKDAGFQSGIGAAAIAIELVTTS